MDVFDVRERLVEDYKAFTTSFVEVHDERLKQHVSDQLERGDQVARTLAHGVGRRDAPVTDADRGALRWVRNQPRPVPRPRGHFS